MKINQSAEMVGHIKKSEIGPDDHLIKKGWRLSPALDGVMFGKLKRYQQACSREARRKIIHEVVDEMPGKFLKDTSTGYFVLVEGNELSDKLETRFHNLSQRVRNKPYQYEGSAESFPAITGWTPEPMRKKSIHMSPSKKLIGDEDHISTVNDESHGHDYECDVCGKGGQLLCCGACRLAFHLECHRPRLNGFPKGKKGCC